MCVVLPEGAVVVGMQDLGLVRQLRQLGALKIVSALRVGIVIIMLVAIQVGEAPRWREQTLLVSGYALAAACAAVIAFSRAGRSLLARRLQLVFAIIDIAAVYGYKLLAPPGAYVPLMVMTLLPIMVVLEVSWRRAAAVLAVCAVAFAAEVYEDPVLVPTVGWTRLTLAVAIYGFLCCTALLAVYVQAKRVDEIVSLSESREQLLAQTMTASDEQQRQVSEFIHDGPLQYVLAARHDISAQAKVQPSEHLDRALASLQNASRQLRDATFELHPEVLEHAGLAAAVEKLAAVTAERSGIAITTDIDYPVTNAADPIVYGVMRELLSNVVRHSQATQASATLKLVDGVCHLDVVDNGVGFSEQVAARRVAQGHIGLASHRARVEAAGGVLTIVDTAVGTHIRAAVPLRSRP
jgi:two-component system, NarL family, sensor kinase